MKLYLTLFASLLLVSLGFSAGLTDISYSGITISQPGSYIVVADLISPQNITCITIATSNVTIDLNGHTLYGPGTTAGSLLSGIYGGIDQKYIKISNGTVRDYRALGIYLLGSNCQVIDVKAIRNGDIGIYVNSQGLIKDCGAEGNNGICGLNAGNGSIVTGNSANYNVGGGIAVGYGSTVSGNNAFNNGGDGIFADNGCTVTGNTADYNSRSGIVVSNGGSVIGNTTYSNSSCGIRVNNGCQATNNTSRYNEIGIQVTGTGTSVSQNVCIYNFSYGLLSIANNYFEQNKLRSNLTANQSLGGATEGAGVLANVIIP
jgi:hypothetical protein